MNGSPTSRITSATCGDCPAARPAGPSVGQRDVVALPGEATRQRGADRLVVLDEQHTQHRHRLDGGSLQPCRSNLALDLDAVLTCGLPMLDA